MFYQDFESPTSSTLPEIWNSGTKYTTNTAGFVINNAARVVYDGDVDVDYGPINASFATNVKIEFYFSWKRKS